MSDKAEELKKRFVLNQVIRYTYPNRDGWDISLGFPFLSGLDVARANTGEELINTIYELIKRDTERRINGLSQSLNALTGAQDDLGQD